ncbi:protein FAM164A [Echinococcus multilocularis]|uniref:Protein FAM164A n=1 Tax=Echinococcus multilocularis TaxID=6211 RepID=A0A068YHC9_ECHMU|nr:protein FAM164A [Echinococcus multilocularis]
MSFTLETEYVSPDRLNLEKCQYCNRRFFSQSLQKHLAACEREWMRENFANDKKAGNASSPKIKEHVTGYDIKVKTFADMLALGAERRMRWRMRHEEFIHTIKTAKANTQREHVGFPFVVEPLSPEVAQAGLTQCECCGRRFNDAAFVKHKDQCKAKQTSNEATSLPFFSASSLESTSAAPSAVIDTEKSPSILRSKQQHEKLVQPQPSNSGTAERVDAVTVQRKTSTPSAPANTVSSSHRTGFHRPIKPPPTVVNNFMNDINGEDTSRREYTEREERVTESGGFGGASGCEKGKCEKPEVMVMLENSEQLNKSYPHNQKHGMRRRESYKISDGDQNSRVVFYKFNSTSTDISQDQKTSQKKYPLHLKIPHQTDGEGNATTVMVLEGGVGSLPSRMAVQEIEGAGVPPYQRTPSARSSGHSDVYDSQSLVLGNYHKSGHHHHRRKNPEPVGIPRSRGSSQSHYSQGNCGSDDGSKKNTSRYCPQCGKKFPSKARFCSSCGAKRKSKVATVDSTNISASHRLTHALSGRDIGCN